MTGADAPKQKDTPAGKLANYNDDMLLDLFEYLLMLQISRKGKANSSDAILDEMILETGGGKLLSAVPGKLRKTNKDDCLHPESSKTDYSKMIANNACFPTEKNIATPLGDYDHGDDDDPDLYYKDADLPLPSSAVTPPPTTPSHHLYHKLMTCLPIN